MSVDRLYILVLISFYLLITGCGGDSDKNVVPSNALPSISSSTDIVQGLIGSTQITQISWSAEAEVKSIDVDNPNVSVPLDVSGISGQFTSDILITKNVDVATYTIIDNDDQVASVTISISRHVDEFTVAFPLEFQIESFHNPDGVMDVEPEPFSYDFADPVCSDALDNGVYDPREYNNYVRDFYSMRTLRDCTDMHQGIDIVHEVDCSGQLYDDNNIPEVLSMCDGVIDRIDAENKCSVYIKCDQGFKNNSMGSSIELVARHLDSFASGLEEGQVIKKGDPIGTMGTCEANLRHLHLSVVREDPHENVSGARLFDPDRGGILKRLGTGVNDIRVVSCNENSTIIRFAFPGNEWGFVQAGVRTTKHGNLFYNAEYVGANADGSDERDDPYYVDGIGFFAYPFNGEQTACNMYESEKDDLCSDIPGSTLRGQGEYYPIECDGIYETVAAVYDLVLLDFGCADLENEIIAGTFMPYAQDVWGYGFRAFEIAP